MLKSCPCPFKLKVSYSWKKEMDKNVLGTTTFTDDSIRHYLTLVGYKEPWATNETNTLSCGEIYPKWLLIKSKILLPIFVFYVLVNKCYSMSHLGPYFLIFSITIWVNTFSMPFPCVIITTKMSFVLSSIPNFLKESLIWWKKIMLD